MSVGSVFLILALLLFMALAVGAVVFRGAEMFAFACLTLGLLLSGIPIPWRGP